MSMRKHTDKSKGLLFGSTMIIILIVAAAIFSDWVGIEYTFEGIVFFLVASIGDCAILVASLMAVLINREDRMKAMDQPN